MRHYIISMLEIPLFTSYFSLIKSLSMRNPPRKIRPFPFPLLIIPRIPAYNIIGIFCKRVSASEKPGRSGAAPFEETGEQG